MIEPRFDTPIERSQTDSYKWRKYGPGVIPMWIADMDFASPEPVIRALREKSSTGCLVTRMDCILSQKTCPTCDR